MKLIVDHSYSLGIAWDRTPFRNHGVVHQAPPATGFFKGSLSFSKARSEPGSLVVIPPSPSMQRIGAVRVRVLAYLDPHGHAAHRHNLVEGELAFALFMNSNGSIQGTFLAPDGRWIGVKSAAQAVTRRAWQLIDYWYDGIGTAEITINGQRVASSSVASELADGPLAGPVRGVGNRGIFVGHWAALDDRHTMDGYIQRVKIYKRDDDDVRKLIDPCCDPPMAYWHDLLKTARGNGYTRETGRKILGEVQEMAAQLFRELTGDSEDDRRELGRLLHELEYAVQHRRHNVPLEPPLRRLVDWLLPRATPEQTARVSNEVPGIIGKLGLSDKQLEDVMKRLCLDRVKDAMVKEGQDVVANPDRGKGPRPGDRKDSGA